jgi:hypothetical protein
MSTLGFAVVGDAERVDDSAEVANATAALDITRLDATTST